MVIPLGATHCSAADQRLSPFRGINWHLEKLACLLFSLFLFCRQFDEEIPPSCLCSESAARARRQLAQLGRAKHFAWLSPEFRTMPWNTSLLVNIANLVCQIHMQTCLKGNLQFSREVQCSNYLFLGRRRGIQQENVTRIYFLIVLITITISYSVWLEDKKTQVSFVYIYDNSKTLYYVFCYVHCLINSCSLHWLQLYQYFKLTNELKSKN